MPVVELGSVLRRTALRWQGSFAGSHTLLAPSRSLLMFSEMLGRDARGCPS